MTALKRLLLALTSLVIMMTACACSFERIDSDDEDFSEPEATTTAEATTSAATTTTEGTTTEAQTTEAEEEDDGSLSISEINQALGSSSGDLYTNDYFDLSFVLPDDDWEFYTTNELYQEAGIDPEDVNTVEKKRAVLPYAAELYGMEATNSDGTAMIAFMVRNLTVEAEGIPTDAAELLDYIASGVTGSYSNADVSELTTRKIGSNYYYYKDVSVNGVTVSMISREEGNFIGLVMVLTSAYSDESQKDLYALLSTADDPAEKPVKEDEPEDEEESSSGSDRSTIVGSISGRTYTNEYFDSSFTIPSSWSFVSNDELMELSGIDPDEIGSESERVEAILGQVGAYICGASASNSTSIVYFQLLNYALYGMEAPDSKTFLESQVSSLEANGYEVGAATSVKIGSNDYSRMECTTESDGLSLTQTILARNVGGYMYFIVMTSVDGYGATGDELISWMADAN